MTLSVALPSPPKGVSALRPSAIVRLAKYCLTAITPEPQDTPAYIVVGATIFPWLTRSIAAALGLDPLTSFVWLSNLQVVPVWTVMVVAQLAGFISRSRTARLLAGVTLTSYLALGAMSLGVRPESASLMTSLMWLVDSIRIAIVGLWTVRSIRSWFTDRSA